MISDYFKLALKNLRKRRLRSWLTIIGIIISIATIFVLISLSLGLEKAVQEQFRLLGTDKIFIQPKGQAGGPGTASSVSLTKKDVDVIEKIQGIKKVTFWTAGNAKIEHNKKIKFVPIIGIDLDTSDLFTETGAYEAQEGRLLKKGDFKNIMIGSRYKNDFLGRPIKIGDTIFINAAPFKVKGILKPIGNPTDDSLIYMPLEDFRPLFDIPERVDTIIAQIESGKDINEISSSIEKKLINSRSLDKDNTDFIILTPEELLESFGSVLIIITAFLAGIAGISLLVGATGIANTMYTSVLERTKEIGVMKAIGAKNSNILIIFLIESGLIGLLGSVVGILLGMLIGKSIEYYAVEYLDTTLLQFSFPSYLIIGCLLFGFLIGTISGSLPSYRASKLKPVDALRYE
ncbi:ABC transporter permease [Candidatus Woesearchaeota archaeon]|nr:ABC transporter permease [Candidatus Woesearchaeota archaeon]